MKGLKKFLLSKDEVTQVKFEAILKGLTEDQRKSILGANELNNISFSLLDLSNSFRYIDLGQVTLNGSSYKYNGTGNGIPLGFFKVTSKF